MGQQTGTIAGEAVQPGSLGPGDGTLPQRHSQKTPGIGDNFTGDFGGQQRLEMTGTDGAKPGSGEPGSAEPFIEMFNQDVGNLANAQVGNYRQQETPPGAENSYSADSQLDNAAPMQEPKNYEATDLEFTGTTKRRMEEPERAVPVEVLKDAIANGVAAPDPKGSTATMYYTTMYKNGKKYNLEVLYDPETNTIYHFMYTRDPIGNLPPIK